MLENISQEQWNTIAGVAIFGLSIIFPPLGFWVSKTRKTIVELLDVIDRAPMKNEELMMNAKKNGLNRASNELHKLIDKKIKQSIEEELNRQISLFTLCF